MDGCQCGYHLAQNPPSFLVHCRLRIHPSFRKAAASSPTCGIPPFLPCRHTWSSKRLSPFCLVDKGIVSNFRWSLFGKGASKHVSDLSDQVRVGWYSWYDANANKIPSLNCASVFDVSSIFASYCDKWEPSSNKLSFTTLCYNKTVSMWIQISELCEALRQLNMPPLV